MARVINTNSPGKRRNAELRTIAELLRRLGGMDAQDAEAKDMIAAVVFCLRAINDTVEESALAWEKRGYWKKAAEFQQKWWWCPLSAQSLERIARAENWDAAPEAMLKLFPHVSDIKVNKLTRKPETWRGAYGRLMNENPR